MRAPEGFERLAVGFICLVAVACMAAILWPRQRLPERPVFHVFGAQITVALPGQKDQMYFRWCDPDTGYMLFANGFEAASTITAVKDARCDGAH